MTKFDAKELFESMKRELGFLDIKELWKAILAYEAGVEDYTDKVDEELENAFMGADRLIDGDLMFNINIRLRD